MAAARISLIGEAYDNVAALFGGTQPADGIEIVATPSPSPEAMRRQLSTWAFDVCEMAFGAYLVAKAQGADVTALPIFPRRAFFHTQFVVHAGAGIGTPGDLHGKRVGVAEYVQSATLWARGVLERDFRLDPRRVDWYVERAGAQSTGAVLGFVPPSELTLRQTPGGARVAAMVEAGELDAALVGGLFQKIDTPLPASVRPLFPDVVLEGKRFLAAHGYVPANHLYMIRGSLARERPDVVRDLYRAFRTTIEAAEHALPSPAEAARLYGNEYLLQTCASLGPAPFAHGIDANRAMLADVIGLCCEQGLISQPPAVADLFAPGIR